MFSVEMERLLDQKVHVLDAVNVFHFSTSWTTWTRDSVPLTPTDFLGRVPPGRGKRRPGIQTGSALSLTTQWRGLSLSVQLAVSTEKSLN